MKASNLWCVAAIAIPLLVACSEPATEPTQAEPSATQAAAPDAAQAPVQGTAVGRIDAIDLQARTITISHGPVPALEWPAMTMTFQAPDANLEGSRPGDEIEFDFETRGMEARILRIQAR